MIDSDKRSDFFLGLIGVAAIGLLVAATLLPVAMLSGNNELTYVDVNPSTMPPTN